MNCTYCGASSEDNEAPVERCEYDITPHCFDCHMDRHDVVVTIHLEVVLKVPKGTRVRPSRDGKGHSILLPTGQSLVPILALEDEDDPSVNVLASEENLKALGLGIAEYNDASVQGNGNVPTEA